MKNHLICLFLVIVFTLGCDENVEIPKTRVELEIEMARIFFESQIANTVSSVIPNSEARSRKSFQKILLWEKADTRSLTKGIGVIIPISYSDERYTAKGNSTVSLSQLSYAMIYKDQIGGQYHVELITTIPDEEYLSSDQSNQQFTGIVNVEDWEGNFLKGFLYKSGEIIEFTREEKKEAKSAKIAEVICITTDWYTCGAFSNGGNGTTWDCHYDYTEIVCSLRPEVARHQIQPHLQQATTILQTLGQEVGVVAALAIHQRRNLKQTRFW